MLYHDRNFRVFQQFFLKGIPTHAQLLFQILVIFGTCVSQMYFLTYQKIASVVAETIASVKKQLHDKEIDLQPLNFIQPIDLREVFCKPSHQANPFNQTNQGNVPKITAASVPVIISTTNLILQAQAHDWKSPDMFDGATPNSVSMQNFKMFYQKRFQFTFGIEILSKYSVITKSLLNWMNWIPRSDLILHITALRHADEDVVLAQYKHRYSRVSGLNDLGLIRLCLWTVWTLFSHHFCQQNWILDFKFKFFSKPNVHTFVIR